MRYFVFKMLVEVEQYREYVATKEAKMNRNICGPACSRTIKFFFPKWIGIILEDFDNVL